jgi:preprotein translocase subunit YajC
MAMQLMIAQTQVAESVSGAGGASNPPAEQPPGFFDNMGYLLPAMVAVTLLYVILMGKPQDRGQSGKAAEMLANLKKNDRVVTAGGILGTVVNTSTDSDYVTLRVDEKTNARMQILASSIVKVVTDEKKSE